MKIIFLDIDGVLCTVAAHVAANKRGLMREFDRTAVGLLNLLGDNEYTAVGEVRTVISSTWRIGRTSHEMVGHLTEFGWKGMLHEHWCTRRLNDIRGVEIQEWLDRHPGIEKYLILDDDSDFLPHQRPFHVKCPCDDGLGWQQFLDAAIVLFGSDAKL